MTLSTQSRPGSRQFLSPRVYRWVCIVALALLAIIIVTGAAVRLTGSGLGCPRWPNCEAGSLAPRDKSDANAMIEFVNRVFTGAVSLAVMLAVLGSLVRKPRRRDLTILSLGLVAGVIAQIVWGGLVVLSNLSPPMVAGHFIISLFLVWDGLVLVQRAGLPDDARPVVAVAPALRWLSWGLISSAWLVVIAGTVVTGTGPHAGDLSAHRYNLNISDVARVHGALVWVLLALTLVSVVMAYRTGASRATKQALSVLAGVIVAQGAIGYIQYFTGVPAALVAAHIAGSVLVFLAAVWVNLTTHRWEPPARAVTPATPAATYQPA